MSAVLIVEDEAGLRQGLCDVITAMGLQAVPAAGLAEARHALGTTAGNDNRPAAFDCVLLDIRLRDGDGLDFLRELRAGPARDVPVIVATAYGDSERTIRAMRDGAFDYLTKPFDLPSLRATVERAIKQRSLLQAAAPALPRDESPANLIGTSAAMLAVWKLIGRAAASDAPVLITGETGTGKELVARAVHRYSPRAAQPFVAVNLAALPPTLIESELFGHERGAFTGASARRSGRFETAGDGTLFLDEIGDLDPALQTKLLRVVQEGGYERVGGNESQASHARLVAATNRAVRPGAPGAALREDLYYRLAVIEIELPPLRARRSDIPVLVAHALRGTPARAVSEEAMAQLSAYAWPGNVRELFHVLQRAAVLCGGEVIDVVNLPEPLRSGESAGGDRSEGGHRDDDDLSLHPAITRLERRLITRALERSKGNRSAAARLLGIGRPLLYAKLEEHGLGARPPANGDSGDDDGA
ncbi:MAG TPA: sigma-54 dependent transcriptional regulator [Polyangia bacterium]|jgi:DNA-binding NtrC family response regulator|nr:sigma-54 dependent transcriptional regulator [Polyangia bacterium]